MKNRFILITTLLWLFTITHAQQEVMRIYQKGPVLRHVKVNEADSFSVSQDGQRSIILHRQFATPRSIATTNIDSITFFQTVDCNAESGLFIGIIGFNSSLSELQISGPYYKNHKTTLHNYIDKLTTDNGTLLYHAVNQSLDNIEARCYPYDLANISVVTFTDGLDQGSWILHLDKYNSAQELLNGVNKRILTEKLHKLPLDAYAIGIRGNDIVDEVSFTNNLKKLTSSPDKISEVNNMNDVNTKFADIAASLSSKNTTTSYSYDLKLTLPGQSPGTRIRFTFDVIDNASNSNQYLEGIIAYNNGIFSLNNIIYKGIKSSSGTTVKGTLSGINLTFPFTNIEIDNGTPLNAKAIQQWNFVPNNLKWQVNSEFDPDQDTETKVDIDRIRNSAVVLLSLDCSSSLGSDFNLMKTAAKNFISILLDGAGDKPLPSSVTTGSTYDISYFTATLQGRVDKEGSSPIEYRGFEYSTNSNFPESDTKRVSILEGGLGTFNLKVSGLLGLTNYYYRAFVISDGNFSFSYTRSFYTLDPAPNVGTYIPIKPGLTSVNLVGHVQEKGNSAISEVGFEYTVSSDFSTNVVKKKADLPLSDDKRFSLNLTGLTPSTQYYFRAYGINNDGKRYGRVVQFKTADPTPPVLSVDANNIRYQTAQLACVIQNVGTSPVTEVGFEYTMNPIFSSGTVTRLVSSVNQHSSFYNELTGLVPATTYYFRAFAKNNEGIGLSVIDSFTTINPIPPQLLTENASDIEDYSAILNGRITSLGTPAVTSTGIEFSTNLDFPDASTIKIFNQIGGVGSFKLKAESLKATTLYYFRTIAIAGGITYYGQTKMFTTLNPYPEVGTIRFQSLTLTSAELEGNLIDAGTSSVVEQGIEYSTNSDFEVNKTTKLIAANTELGSFIVNANGLTSATRYYYRAYAKNNKGIAHGDTLSFLTYFSQVSDIDGNNYYTTKIGTQEWMASNLKTTKYSNGEAIPFVRDGTKWAEIRPSYIYGKAYCFYQWEYNDDKFGYGALYNYMAAVNGVIQNPSQTKKVQGACPEGWHIPSDDEWKTLEMELGMSKAQVDSTGLRGNNHGQGDLLRSNNGWRWDVNGSDHYGFASLASGARGINSGSFFDDRYAAYYWSSTITEVASIYVYGRKFVPSPKIERNRFVNTYGLSVRCIKD